MRKIVEISLRTSPKSIRMHHTNVTDTPFECYGYVALIIRFSSTDSADDDSDDSGGIYIFGGGGLFAELSIYLISILYI